MVRPNGPLGYCISKLSTSFRFAKGRVNMDRLGGRAVISGRGTLRDIDPLAYEEQIARCEWPYARRLTLPESTRTLSERAILARLPW